MTRTGQRYRIQARDFSVDAEFVRFYEEAGRYPTAVFAVASVRFLHDEDATPIEEVGAGGERRKGGRAQRLKCLRGEATGIPDRPASLVVARARPAESLGGQARAEPFPGEPAFPPCPPAPPRGPGRGQASRPKARPGRAEDPSGKKGSRPEPARSDREPRQRGGADAPGRIEPPRDLAGALAEEACSLEYYVLVDRTPVRAHSFERWRNWMWEASLTVNTSRVGPYRVETQFLGVAVLGSRPPRLWLSRVTERGREISTGRCAGSWEQAEALHCEMFARANQLTRGPRATYFPRDRDGVL